MARHVGDFGSAGLEALQYLFHRVAHCLRNGSFTVGRTSVRNLRIGRLKSALRKNAKPIAG